MQLLLGRLIKPRQHVDIRVRPISNIVHIVLGIALTAIGFAQISLGMDLYAEKTGRSVPRAVKIVCEFLVPLVPSLREGVELNWYSRGHHHRTVLRNLRSHISPQGQPSAKQDVHEGETTASETESNSTFRQAQRERY